MYKLDATLVKLVFIEEPEYISEPGSIDLGQGDLTIDTGDRTNDGSLIDQGLR